MQASLKNDHPKSKMQRLKNAQAYRPATNLVFSYLTTKHDSTIVLTQQETGFHLNIAIEKLEGGLHVRRFNLTHSDQLEEFSVALYDAALIEIILESLTLLFIEAHQQRADEINFALSDEDAKHLTPFEGLLEACTVSMTGEGKRTIFTLFSCMNAQKVLREKAELIKTQVKYELWKGQRYDPFLKDYLQMHPRGKLLSCCQPTLPQISSSKGIILSFPLKEMP